MFAVIFKAEINKFDKTYSTMADAMRKLAINNYGCTEFNSMKQDKHEIAISYWKNLDDIQQWKKDSQHLIAQKLGKTHWYKRYSVQVVEIIREYDNFS